MPPLESDANEATCLQPDAADRLRAEYVQAIAKTVTEQFDKIDKDGNGFINKKELIDAIAAAPKSTKEREYLTALSSHMRDVASLSNDQWGPEWSGISRQDLGKLSRLAGDMPIEMALVRDIRSRYGVLERNHSVNRLIEQSDLDSYPSEVQQKFQVVFDISDQKT